MDKANHHESTVLEINIISNFQRKDLLEQVMKNTVFVNNHIIVTLVV